MILEIVGEVKIVLSFFYFSYLVLEFKEFYRVLFFVFGFLLIHLRPRLKLVREELILHFFKRRKTISSHWKVGRGVSSVNQIITMYTLSIEMIWTVFLLFQFLPFFLVLGIVLGVFVLLNQFLNFEKFLTPNLEFALRTWLV